MDTLILISVMLVVISALDLGRTEQATKAIEKTLVYISLVCLVALAWMVALA